MSTADSKKKRGGLQKRLGEIDSVMKGSLAEVELTCGTPGCRCHKKGPKHKGLYFSYRHGGRSHTIYVPKAMQEDARKAHANWKKLKKLLEEVTDEEAKRLRSGKKRFLGMKKGGRK